MSNIKKYIVNNDIIRENNVKKTRFGIKLRKLIGKAPKGEATKIEETVMEDHFLTLDKFTDKKQINIYKKDNPQREKRKRFWHLCGFLKL